MMIKKHLIKYIFFIFLLINFFYYGKTSIFSQKDFIVNSEVVYDVDPKGSTKVYNIISIENLNTERYAPSYVLNLNSITPQNIKAYDDKREFELIKTTSNNTTSIEVVFSDTLVGKNKKRRFIIEYDEDSFVRKTGEVWEVSIPKLQNPDQYDEYNVILKVPTEFGNEAYISPTPDIEKSSELKDSYIFSKEKVSKTGITAGFGKFQVFSFELNYHIENPLNEISEIEISLPPDTSTQQVYYENVSPVPENVHLDLDGNWLANYSLNPRQKLDIKAKGVVQLLSTPRRLLQPDLHMLNVYLEPREYWESENEKIALLSRQLKDPKSIYEFVKNTLSYDFSRVKPNVQRLGALHALENPTEAICMEYTDLFIALSRAAGIPAREINGYAYTENEKLQPLSLVADVLHSWPEYWDDSNNTWIPVDPTWGSTSGQDYFSKLDLRHFTFVIHGQDPVRPYSVGSYKLGEEPQKDVFISFGNLPTDNSKNIDIFADKHFATPIFPGKVNFTIINKSQTALYGLVPKVFFDSIVVDSKYIDVMPPYSVNKFSVEIPNSIFASNTPENIRLKVDQNEVEVSTQKKQMIIINILTLFLIIIAIIVIIFFRYKNISINLRRLKTLGFLNRKTV